MVYLISQDSKFCSGIPNSGSAETAAAFDKMVYGQSRQQIVSESNAMMDNLIASWNRCNGTVFQVYVERNELMYDKHILTDEGCRSIWSAVRGWLLRKHQNQLLQGLPLSCIEIALKTDGGSQS